MSKVQSVKPPVQIGLVSDGLGLWALWSHDAGDDPKTAVRYIRADLHEARIRELEAECKLVRESALREAAAVVLSDIEAVRAEEGEFSGTAFSMEKDAIAILALIKKGQDQ